MIKKNISAKSRVFGLKAKFFLSHVWPFFHKNLRSRSGMHLCMHYDQNGQETMVLPSADKTRLTHFILLKTIFLVANGLCSLAADGNTIMNLPWYPRKIVHFTLVLSHKKGLRFICFFTLIARSSCHAGLPDFSCYKRPIWGKYNKLPRTVPNVHKI
jgi:hypothetical protein